MASREVEPTDAGPGSTAPAPAEHTNPETVIYRQAAAEAVESGGRLAVLLAPYSFPDLASLGVEDGGPAPAAP